MSISELFLIQRAISQIQIDEILVWDADFVGQPLEIGHSRFIQPNGDGLLQLPAVRIALPLHL